MFNIFVYCGGKCGSHTLYNTLINNNYQTIHLHNNLDHKRNTSNENCIFNMLSICYSLDKTNLIKSVFSQKYHPQENYIFCRDVP